MAFTNIYQKTIKGNLVQIGNTLGLSKASNALTPGTLGSIGAFITTQNLTAAGGWPSGTTLNFAQNSSSAILSLPAGAVVDYAELIWSASYVVPGSDVTASIGNNINFTNPLGTTSSISASGVNTIGIALSENAENSTNYVKSSNVTSIVQAGGSGTYTCGNVPSALSATSNSVTFAGWSLYVVYTLTSDPVRNIIIFVGQTVSIDVPYAVPINYPGPPFPIRMFYSVGEGDAIITADQFNTRPGTGVNSVLIGTPVQPSGSNPFASIIGDQSGGIDTTGTFGTRNPSGTTNTNISAGRQGWDIANNINLLPAFTGGAVASLGLDIGTNSDPAIMNSNGFVVDLSQPIASLTKSANKTVARAGETLTYTLVYRFTTVPMSTNNIVIIDTVPSGVTYKPGTVIVNGTPQASFNPNPPGISLGTILAVSTFTVTYDVTVNSTLSAVTIPNDAFGSYNFTSGGTAFTNENTSNTSIVIVDPFSATATKSADLAFADIGQTITYTITIPNNGATLTNVIFRDTVPNGTTFVLDSLTINGVTQNGITPNPPGATIPNINTNTITTISFKVTVTTIPSPNPIPNSATILTSYVGTVPNSTQAINTNIVTTQVNNGDLISTKFVDKDYANVNDVLTYTIVMKNTGNVTTENIQFIDVIPTDTTLVPNSFKQNGVTITNPDPNVAVPLNPIRFGGTTTVVFKVTVNTIPNLNPIPNSSRAIYSFFFSPSQTGKSGSSFSNTVVTTINNANLGLSTKSVDKAFANCGDTLTYTILIPNSGNVTAQNVICKDTIPNGTALIPTSVFVNNVSAPGANPNTGVTIPNIAPGQTATVTFSVKVTCL